MATVVLDSGPIGRRYCPENFAEIRNWILQENPPKLFCSFGQISAKIGYGLLANMTPETRDVILENIENALRSAGSADYETGIATVSTLLDWCRNHIEMIRTRQHLALILETLPPMDPEEESMAVACTALLPQLVASTVGDLYKQFSSDFKPAATGRPNVLGKDQYLRLVKYVGDMHVQGYTLSVCKRRAATKFGVSVRTVERIWQVRASLMEGRREISFQEAKDWIVSMMNNPSSHKPHMPEGHN